MDVDDQAKVELEEIIALLDIDRIVSKTVHAFDLLVTRKVRRPKSNKDSIWDAQAASLFFTNCRHIVEGELKLLASRFSSVQWLWYIRRLPKGVFRGSLSTTYGYDRGLAEVMTGLGSSAPYRASLEANLIRYKVDKDVAKYLLEFCAGVQYLSQIHVNLRLAGKGIAFRFAARTFPEIVPNPAVEEAIRLYDERVAKDVVPLSRVGTSISSFEAATQLEGTVLGIYGITGNPILPTLATSKSKAKLLVQHNYIPAPIALVDIARLKSDPRLVGVNWFSQTGSLILLLWLTLPVMLELSASSISIPQFGYYLIREAYFLSFIDNLLPIATKQIQAILPTVELPTNAQQFLYELRALIGSAYPLRLGPVIRRSKDLIQIDLVAATNQLNYLLEFPKVTGAPPKARGDHFETAVQRLIDNSNWCPSTDLASYRGRTLRLNKEKITDLDAIGELNGVLLLVSCKSFIYSAAYDIGEYKTVRNLITEIENAVSKWHLVIEKLRQAPKGDNYDFSKYTNIIGVVCLPTVFYVPIGSATEYVLPGLRSAVSISELKRWLGC